MGGADRCARAPALAICTARGVRGPGAEPSGPHSPVGAAPHWADPESESGEGRGPSPPKCAAASPNGPSPPQATCHLGSEGVALGGRLYDMRRVMHLPYLRQRHDAAGRRTKAGEGQKAKLPGQPANPRRWPRDLSRRRPSVWARPADAAGRERQGERAR
ncbi:hypothetical protein CDD83_11222 [Cordyceps sp. RAO-2017]|nr:hypothetical protein CDD83_11222 [Cordyceps sp. RAO-2017]